MKAGYTIKGTNMSEIWRKEQDLRKIGLVRKGNVYTSFCFKRFNFVLKLRMTRN